MPKFFSEQNGEIPLKVMLTILRSSNLNTLLNVTSLINKDWYFLTKSVINSRKYHFEWEGKRLMLEQILIDQNQEIQERLKFHLHRIEQHFKNPPTCHITVASPFPEYQYENWIKHFLAILTAHLSCAGISTNYIEQSDIVLLFGTESLLKAHQRVTGEICNELVLINDKREKKPGCVFPILLSGKCEKSFPAYFRMYNNIIDWREKSYLHDLQDLIRNIYKIDPDNQIYKKIFIDLEKDIAAVGNIYGLLANGLHKKLTLTLLDQENTHVEYRQI